jgi:hypothetical protein
MATLKELHEFAVEQGIEQDPRDQKQIDRLLEERKERYEELDGVREEQYDEDRLENPFDDSKVLHGGDQDISKLAVGIDVEVSDLVLIDRLNESGKGIDGVLSHHPNGIAYARLGNVMNLQIDLLSQAGISVSQAEAVIKSRADEVRKGLHARNHPREPQAAELLGLPFACAHTITDNYAYQFAKDYLAEEEPRTLGDIIDALLELEEYQWELGQGMGPQIFVGNKDSRAGKFGVLGFTGGTDPGEDVIEKMVDAGIDTLVAMHAGKGQLDKAKEHNLNVISTGHMASDSLGVNLLLDEVQDEFDVEIVGLSGFKRVER